MYRQPVLRRVLPVAALLTLTRTAAASGPAQTLPDYPEQRRRLISMQVSALCEGWLAAHDVPGAVIALVEDDQTLMLAGYGVTTVGTQQAVDPHTTLFHVAELVRPVTAAAVLQLVETGRLRLDTNLVGRPLDILPVSNDLGPVTAIDLLLHTAGFDSRVIATRARTPGDILPLELYLERRLPPRVRPAGVLSIPSSFDFALAGRIVERLSGKTFASYVEDHLFEPLEMHHSTVRASLPADTSSAAGHRKTGGTLRVVEDPDLPQALPASHLSTTAADMGRWLRALLAGGGLEDRRILTAASVDALLRPRFTQHPSLSGRTLAYREGRFYAPAEIYVAAQGNGFTSVAMIHRRAGIGLFIALNHEVRFWPLVYSILDLFDIERAATASARLEPPPGGLEKLVGYWRNAATAQRSPEKLLSLIAQDRMTFGTVGELVWRSSTLLPIAADTLLEQNGNTRYYLLDHQDRLRLATSDGQILERLDWLESRPVQIALWTLFTTLFLAIGWPRPALPEGSPYLRPADAYRPRWPLTAARLAAALHFVFIAALAVCVAVTLRSDIPWLLFEVPLALRVVLVVPLLALVSTSIATLGLWAVWRSPFWSLPRRLAHTGIVLALLAFAAFLRSWNLLGFHL